MTTPQQYDEELKRLATLILHGHKILFVTGAGLSVASGITPYRASKEAIWNKFLTSWGTRQMFLDNPLDWWNKFWLRTHEKPEFLDAKPNAGHFAIAQITQRCNARIVTQNIDRLHPITLNVRKDRLIEVHGRLGLYKCVNDGCVYSFEDSISKINLDDYAVPGTSMVQGNLQLKDAPICPECYHPILPQSLLFDEQYDSHSFYQSEKVHEWFDDSDVIVFVGTSFSVGITEEALFVAKKQKKIVFNFNIHADEFECEHYNIIGPSEEMLPKLYNYMMILAGKPRIYFYPTSMYSNKYAIPPCRVTFDHVIPNKRQKVENL